MLGGHVLYLRSPDVHNRPRIKRRPNSTLTAPVTRDRIFAERSLFTRVYMTRGKHWQDHRPASHATMGVGGVGRLLPRTSAEVVASDK